MIGRITQGKPEVQEPSSQGFDDYEMRLGDVMRGERATMGKSLMDVHRELRIKADYIDAIENCDPSKFDTQSFIAGYVRSYARYLGMDPDEAFAAFCAESGFEVAHGMSHEASDIRKSQARRDRAPTSAADNVLFDGGKLPYAPAPDSWLSRIEPSAIGSSLVLVALLAGIGYGGWSVLQEIQRVQVTPVDQTPVVLSQLDPLDAATAAAQDPEAPQAVAAAVTRPSSAAFDRLYRPQALDVPVLVSRDAPISTLDPESVGSFSNGAIAQIPQVEESIDAAVAIALSEQITLPDSPAPDAPAEGPRFAAAPVLPAASATLGAPQVLENPVPGITVVATAETWVEVTAPSGKKLFAQTLKAGETYQVPATEQPPTIFSGNAGGVYFAVNGVTYGPYGQSGKFGRNLALDATAIADKMQVADLSQNAPLAKTVAQLRLNGANY
jgi:cytoskeletal protein RodZ